MNRRVQYILALWIIALALFMTQGSCNKDIAKHLDALKSQADRSSNPKTHEIFPKRCREWYPVRVDTDRYVEYRQGEPVIVPGESVLVEVPINCDSALAAQKAKNAPNIIKVPVYVPVKQRIDSVLIANTFRQKDMADVVIAESERDALKIKSDSLSADIIKKKQEISDLHHTVKGRTQYLAITWGLIALVAGVGIAKRIYKSKVVKLIS